MISFVFIRACALQRFGAQAWPTMFWFRLVRVRYTAQASLQNTSVRAGKDCFHM